jgi:hypothetical protein
MSKVKCEAVVPDERVVRYERYTYAADTTCGTSRGAREIGSDLRLQRGLALAYVARARVRLI